jgi:RNA polymerase sigma-70 factor (ECF subfamily)
VLSDNRFTSRAESRQRAAGGGPSKVQGVGSISDGDLVSRARQADASAFEELYRRHAGRLYNLALRMTRNAQDAEDLLQESFLLAHRKLAAFRGESSFGTWLYRLGMNLCLDHLRSKGVKMNQATDSFEEEEGTWEPPSSDRSLEMTVNRLDLERAIDRLPPAARAAFLLHDVEGFEHGQVAEILGIAEGTSKSQVHKARHRLRRILGTAR